MTAILPFYLPLFIPIDLRFLRILRITRVLRIFKLQRYSDSIQLMGLVFRRRSKELLITVLVTFLMLTSVCVGDVLYGKRDATRSVSQHNCFIMVGCNYTYHSWLWGYISGDCRWKGTCRGNCALGIGLVAFPAGIVSSGFLRGDAE